MVGVSVTDRFLYHSRAPWTNYTSLAVIIDTLKLKNIEVLFFQSLGWNLDHKEWTVFVGGIMLEHSHLVTL